MSTRLSCRRRAPRNLDKKSRRWCRSRKFSRHPRPRTTYSSCWRSMTMAGERTKTAALALVLAVFVLGVAIGGLGMYLARNKVMGANVQPPVDHSPTAARARTVDRMTHELSLTADQ